MGVAAVAGPRTDRYDRAVVLEAREHRALGGNQLSDLGSHPLEHLGRRRALRHQGRDASQRRLLLREPFELFARLAIRDRRRDELGELRETVLDVVGKRRSGHRRQDHAPDPAVDDDRRAGDVVEPALTSLGGQCATQLRVILEPGRTTSPENLGGHRPAVERPARARREAPGARARGGEHYEHGAFIFVATDRGSRKVHDLHHLLRDR
jgi:hypothetical protein